MGQIHSAIIKVIGQSIPKLLSRNQIQDGCYGGHIEKAAMLFFKRNLTLDGPNTPCRFQSNRSRHSKVIERTPYSRWLLWWPYWKSCNTGFRKEPFPGWAKYTLSISKQSVKAFNSYWAETKFSWCHGFKNRFRLLNFELIQELLLPYL